MGGGKSSGGGGESTSTVYQNADPWVGQQPYLKEIFSNAQNLYKNGGLAPEYYTGNTLAPMDAATSKALALQEQRALSGNAGMNAAQGQLASTMSGQYLNNNPFADPNTSPDFLSQYQAGGNAPLSTYAQETGMPSFLQTFGQEQGNPQLDAMVQRAIGQANAGVAGNFAAAGRYGSGAFNAAANDAAGNIATQMYGQAYDQDQNRALSAWSDDQNRRLAADDAMKNRNLSAWDSTQNRQLSAWDSTQNRDLSAWGQNQSNQLSAWNSALDRQLSAYNTERDNQMKGMLFAPELAAADYQDISALSEVGTARENYAQDKINADMDRYNYNADRDALGLQNYMNLVSGNYGSQGSSTSTVPEARSNPLGGALSGALGGGALGLMLGGGPIGAGVGAGLGGLLSLF
jgi:hypothetical protein